MKKPFLLLLFTLIPAAVSNAAEYTVARVFWQDDDSARLLYGDLVRDGDAWSLKPNSIEAFPELDPGSQNLVQMSLCEGYLVSGVRDRQDGALGSGIVAVDTGVVEEPHGDHSHWSYRDAPRIAMTQIDSEQGNPAHVYRCGSTFAIANDKKGGFTLLSTKNLRNQKATKPTTKFYSGGSGHITLAIAEDKVAYATWIDAEGENAGRVDVVSLTASKDERYSIRCKSGVLHGATANSGRAFFAPKAGIEWVDMDLEFENANTNVTPERIDLGTDSDGSPIRTGSFANHGQLVLFTAGRGDQSKLFWIDAEQSTPQAKSIVLQSEADQRLSTPFPVTNFLDDPFAVLIAQSAETPEKDSLFVVSLDANDDGRTGDVRVIKSMTIGPNEMHHHSGMHGVTTTDSGRYVLVSNPGDATVWVLSTRKWEVVAKLSVGGKPTRLLAVGG